MPIVGTRPEAIDLAEDRGRFGQVLVNAGLPAPEVRHRHQLRRGPRIASAIGYPVLVRPSYVLGGRGMEIVYDEKTLHGYITRATQLARAPGPGRPVPRGRHRDRRRRTVRRHRGLHRRDHGAHRGGRYPPGDSACALPPVTLGAAISTRCAVPPRPSPTASAWWVCSTSSTRWDDVLYVLEANPRASRTVLFVSKATAVPLAKACARVMLGASISQLREEGLLARHGDGSNPDPNAPIAVWEAVLPFRRFRRMDGSGIDSLLGPEMKSTGEVMGIDHDFGSAFAKSQTAAYGSLPNSGTVFVSVANRDKRSLVFPVKRLADLGFRVLATDGTCRDVAPQRYSLQHRSQTLRGPRRGPSGVDRTSDAINAGEVDMVINTRTATPGRVSTATRSARRRWRRTSRV